MLVMPVDTSSSSSSGSLLTLRYVPYTFGTTSRRGAIGQTGPQAILQLCPPPPPPPLHSAATVLILIIYTPHLLLIAGLSPCFQLSIPCALLLPTFTVHRTGWPRVDKIHCVVVMAILFLPLIPVSIAGLSP